MDLNQNIKEISNDVFLSFRGLDTRKKFVCHLYSALEARNICTFKDNRKLEPGDSIPEELSNAIQISRCAVVVISENYATSKWCLEELRLIMELRRKNKIKVVPIFYEVKPSDVRHQQGNFALELHHDPKMAEKLPEWRKALTDIAYLHGKEPKEFEDDAKLIEDIVHRISSRLLTLPPINLDDFVGMEAHMKSLRPLLDIDSKDDARIIGICGMGGIGKTTIAKYLYEKLKPSFSPHRCYLMVNVAKLSGEHGLGLLELQRRILKWFFREKNKLESVEHGSQQLEYRLRNIKVLLVLDNVDDERQLYALAKEVSWFGPGSRIIITTRDKRVLYLCGMNFVKYVYDVKYLDDADAHSLFKRIASKWEHPPSRLYEDVSNYVLRLAQGHPLVLEALVASLRGKTIYECLSALISLKRVPDRNLVKILKSSWAGLEEPAKSAFLNIAKFWNGYPLWFATTLLDGGENGVKILAKKSLIDISADGRIIMHDLVMNKPCGFPTHRRILGSPAEINEILADTEGITRVEGLVLDDFVTSLDFLEWEHFEPMQNLNYLIIYPRNDGLNSMKCRNLKRNCLIPRKLKLLRWDDYPFTTLPSIMSNCLVEVNLRYSKLRKLWSGTPWLLHLRKLDLTGSKDLKELPDLQKASSLEKLLLEGCISLKKIPESVRSLSKLQEVDVSNCDGLKNSGIIVRESNATVFQGTSLPVKSVCMDILDAGPSLNESHNISLTKVSVQGNIIIDLKVLGGYTEYVSVNSEPQIPHQLMILEQQMDGLMSPPYSFKSLDIERFDCNKESGPFKCHSFSGFPWLTELYLINLNIKTVPDDIHQMLVLEILNLSGNDFSSLPSSMIDLLKLKHLILCHCHRLEKLPKLYQLEKLAISDCTNLRALVNLSDADQDTGRYNLRELWVNNCKNVESLTDDLSHFAKLTFLDISRHDWEAVPTSIKDLSSLTTLCVNYCKKLKSLTKLPLSLKYLFTHGCDSLESSSLPMEQCLDISPCFDSRQYR